jgi:glutamyl-Q tRNA(Asp) synthetase
LAKNPYIGRFAPSPTGSLHFGSLVAAVGSYLQAQVARGKWLLRIEDLDTPRVVAGAADEIVRTLDSLGFEWDGAVEFQSRRIDLYVDALGELFQHNHIYPCSCSRAEVAAIDEQRYPGTCRSGLSRIDGPIALRFKVESGPTEFVDNLQGRFALDIAQDSGDFVVKRRDGQFAYHLAVVVDDAAQGISEVVRGADLLESTPRHLLLQRALRLPSPEYCHLPLVVDASGRKLSKAEQSLPIDRNHASDGLWHALRFLKQSPPPELRVAQVDEIWRWARASWTLEPLRQLKSDRAP